MSYQPYIKNSGGGLDEIKLPIANVVDLENALAAKAEASDIPTKLSELTNDSGYTKNAGTITGITMNGASKGTSGVVNLGTVLTSHQDISGKQDKLTAGTNITISGSTISAKDTTYSVATTSANGLMSASDKTKLDGIASGANKTTVDTAMSSTSTNPVQNKVVNSAISGKTNTSVMPNDSGEIKTKFRCSQRGYTAGATWYYKLCTLPANDAGNYASAIISGRIGGWVASNLSYINALAWNRDGAGIALMDIAGTTTAMSGVWNIGDLVMYVNSDNTATLYVKCYNYFTFDLDIELFQSGATLTYDGTYVTSVSGTLSAQASTTTKRVEIANGKLLVNGSAVALESAIPTNYVTTNTAQTIAGAKTFTSEIYAQEGGIYVELNGETVFKVGRTDGEANITIDGGGTGAVPLILDMDAGTSGQVLTSQGAGATPKWTTPTSPLQTTRTIDATTLAAGVHYWSLSSGSYTIKWKNGISTESKTIYTTAGSAMVTVYDQYNMQIDITERQSPYSGVRKTVFVTSADLLNSTRTYHNWVRIYENGEGDTLIGSNEWGYLDISTGYSNTASADTGSYKITLARDATNTMLSQSINAVNGIPFHCTINKPQYGGITCTLFKNDGETTTGYNYGWEDSIDINVLEYSGDSSVYVYVMLNGSVSTYI